MSKEIEEFYYLYNKYGVDCSILEKLSDDEIIKGAKGVLAELDLRKNRQYDQNDIDIIRTIYSLYC